MDYISYYENVVKQRQSCRSFTDDKVDTAILDEVKAYFESCQPLVPSIETELGFFDGAVADRLGMSVGYNGFIIRAPQYLVVFSEDKEHYLENAAFLAQAVTLKLTEKDIATCWLTVNDAAFAKKALGKETDKEVAVVVGFGQRDEEEDVRLDIVSPSNVKMVKNEEQAAPKISLEDMLYYKTYGHKEDMNLYMELEAGLHSISTAQSFFNRQPYRVIVDDDIISLIGIPDEMTTESDKHLNYGIAMSNFSIVLGTVRAEAPVWNFEKPDRDLALPEDCVFVASCHI